MGGAANAGSRHLSWEELHDDACALARHLGKIKSWEVIVAVTRGGLVPAAIIARELDIRPVETLGIASYDGCRQSDVRLLKPLGADVAVCGAKHLMELAEMVKQGHRAVMVYLIQREDGEKLALAADLDPDYARAFVAATACGVEALAYQCCITLDDITVTKPVPILAPDI